MKQKRKPRTKKEITTGDLAKPSSPEDKKRIKIDEVMVYDCIAAYYSGDELTKYRTQQRSQRRGLRNNM